MVIAVARLLLRMSGSKNPPKLRLCVNGGGCLSGFELLMRHVELWREEVRGNIVIEERNTAFSSYRRGPIGYSDLPAYKWNENFKIEHFQGELKHFNSSECKAFCENIEDSKFSILVESETERAEKMSWFNRDLRKRNWAEKLVRRTSFAPTLEKTLAATEDIKLCMFLPVKFLHYASNLLRQALIDRGIIAENEEGPQILCDAMEGYADADKKQHGGGEDKDHERTTPVCWRINAITAWQQIDRRIDEVYEILWALYHSHSKMAYAGKREVVRRFFSEVSRRAIRPTPNDEFMAFAGWVGRAAPNKHKEHQIDFETGEGEWNWDTDEEADRLLG